MKKLFIVSLSVVLMAVLSFSALARHIVGDSIKSDSLPAHSETVLEENEDLPQEKVLPQVENLNFEESLRGAVSLSWDKIPEAYAYNIFIKTDDSKKYKYCLTVKSNKVTVKNIDSEGDLKFKVRGFCYDSGKAVFGPFSKAVGGVTAPEDVDKLYTRSITNDSVTLYWNKAKGATGYNVYIFDKEKDEFILYKSTSRTLITVSELKKDTLYTFKVQSYKKVNNSTALGKFSKEHEEYTYNSGAVPHTKSQAAQYYNNHIAKLKAQKDMTVKYQKSIDTQFISCSKQNLTVSVKNTINLFEGTLKKIYKYVDGENETKSVNKLIEPYGKTPTLERDDIKEYSAETREDGSVVLKITLKSENKFYTKGQKSQKSYYDGVLSLPNYKNLKTSPFLIENADSYYSGGTLTIKVKDRKVQVFKIDAAVLSNIGFSVSDVKASAIVAYGLEERYDVKYDLN